MATGALPQLGYLFADILLFPCEPLSSKLELSGRQGLDLFVAAAAFFAAINVATGVWLRRAFDGVPLQHLRHRHRVLQFSPACPYRFRAGHTVFRSEIQLFSCS